MDPADNEMAECVVIISGMFADWNAHDLDRVYSHLADDYHEYLNGVLAKSGREEARAADQALYDMVPDYRRTVEELWGQNDRVISRFFISGTLTGGERFELAVAAIFGIRDGQVAEAHLYFDPSSAVRAN
jgi:ketosteroid isomerase-like protein